MFSQSFLGERLQSILRLGEGFCPALLSSEFLKENGSQGVLLGRWQLFRFAQGFFKQISHCNLRLKHHHTPDGEER